MNRDLSFHEIALGIVTPMANERETAVRFVREVIDRCRPYAFRSLRLFVVFDRTCRDGTRELLIEAAIPEVEIVDAPENRCVVDAYLRGYRQALAGGCDWILEIDAGFSHDPAEIPSFLAAMRQGHECVFGVRFGPGGGGFSGPWRRRLISLGGTWLANLVLGTRMADMTSGYEFFSRGALEKILAWGIESRGPFFQTEIRAFAHGLDHATVPITYRAPSHQIGGTVLAESLKSLWRLRQRRVW
ncbi:MAG: glycosyltransferase [Magnetococcales bacterium]|nr:glycosyltransferase [Magnetococcales bacterium]MBF0156776.1 glycosyltransferase [Magnetococcales bacterium]